MEEAKILITGKNRKNLDSLNDILQSLDVKLISTTSDRISTLNVLIHDYVVALIDADADTDIHDIIRKIRSSKLTHSVPIILLASKNFMDEFLKSDIDTELVDFLPKPIKKNLLLNKVNVFLEVFLQRKKLESEIERRRISEYNLKKTERRLLEAKQKAEESDRLKSTFLANMSHEIRTPMNAIIGFANLLGNDELDHEEKIEYVNYIRNSSRTLLNLIDDIIDIAKIEAGQLSINPTAVPIRSIFKEMQVSYEKELINRGKSHLELKLNIPERDSEDYVFADESRFRQVFSNILNNAIKFTQEGYIEFGYYQIPNAEDIMFFVRDTGIGIPEDKLDVIFNRFEQVKDERIAKNEGTGLGLSISKRIIELQGGEIAVESVVGEGSYFYFTLKSFTEREKAILDNEQMDRSHSVSSSELNLKNKTILIAEDEMFNFQFLKELLRPTNAKIIWAKSGMEAVEIVKEHISLDLILMDIKMPELDGYEATRQIKAIAPNMPIFAQTAYAMAGEKKLNKNAGFNEYLTKPIRASELLKLIIKYIPVKAEVK